MDLEFDIPGKPHLKYDKTAEAILKPPTSKILINPETGDVKFDAARHNEMAGTGPYHMEDPKTSAHEGERTNDYKLSEFLQNIQEEDMLPILVTSAEILWDFKTVSCTLNTT